MTNGTRVVLLRRARRPNGPNAAIRAVPAALATGCLGLVVLMLLPFVAVVGLAAGVYAYFAQDLPEPGTMRGATAAFQTTKIYGRPVSDPATGKLEAPLLYEIFDPQGGKRTLVPMELLKKQRHVINATIAIEDANFYTNPGIDFRGIARAAYMTLTGQDLSLIHI